MERNEVLNFIKEKIEGRKIIKIIFSDLNKKRSEDFSYKKIIVKPILIKDKFCVQMEKFTEKQSFHTNYIEDNFKGLFLELDELLYFFKQVLLKIEGKEILFSKKKNESFSLKEKQSNLKVEIKNHDKVKKYILNEGEEIDFLIELGIMNEKGKILKNSYNKFRQINKYLEFIDDTIKELLEKKLIKNHINILDFGCGKSYLTFALYYYLITKRKNLTFNIIGLDLKKDVIELCNSLVKKLAYKNIEFINIDIKDFKGEEVDLVFSLHACNNATDYSILKALELNSKAILAVPCCQHEFYDKISKQENSPLKNNLNIMTTNGIILEKLATLATDSFRALALEMCDYKVKIIEFIDTEHTPKNNLIKAIKNSNNNLVEKVKSKKIEEYKKFKEFLGLSPLLENLIEKYYKIK